MYKKITEQPIATIIAYADGSLKHSYITNTMGSNESDNIQAEMGVACYLPDFDVTRWKMWGGNSIKNVNRRLAVCAHPQISVRRSCQKCKKYSN